MTFNLKNFALLIPFSVALLSGACRSGANVPQPGTAEYRKTVSAFYVGLAALQVGDDSRAEQYLNETAQLAPDEPAGWADLGLLAFRQKDFDKAFDRLSRARALAPDNTGIIVLLAAIESNRGHINEAISLLRRAVELDPKNARAAYALASEIERAGGEGADAQSLKLMQGISANQPNNIAVLLEVARLAAKTGDSSPLKDAVARIGAHSVVQTPEAQEQFAQLRAAADSPNPRAAATRVVFLRNVLLRAPQYRQNLLAVRLPPEEGGEPFVKFVLMQNPAPAPSEPDEKIAFSVQSLPGVNGGENCVWASAVSLDGSGAPVGVALCSGNVMLSNNVRLPFPVGRERPGANGVLAVDLNYDFKTDLVLAGSGGVRILRQEAADKWTDVTSRAKLPPEVVNGDYVGAWAADVDLDGDLDIVLGRRAGGALALRNNGDDTFKPIEPFNGASNLRAFAWADLDRDGDPDAATLGDDGAIKAFFNERGGQLTEKTLPANGARHVAMTIGDLNSDGALDICALTVDGKLMLYSFDPDKAAGQEWTSKELAAWTEAKEILNSSRDISAQLFVIDVDNNGSPDIVASLSSAANGTSAARVWLSDKDAAFKPLAAPINMSVFAVADMMNNGAMDLIGADSAQHPVIAVNHGAKNYHWQTLRPRAQQTTGDQRINSFGIGGEMEIRAGLLTQKQIINSPIVHFGLGDQIAADVVRIVWPNGSPRAEFDLKADQAILAEQRLKGSCPSLFAWNGKEMSFVKDCSPWSSAIGLRINAQDTAGILQPEEWMKIPGESLAPRKGENGEGDYYDLRITAELWETYYIDHYSLMTVDHPADTEIYVDERFSVPPPKLKIYATTPPRPFAHAIDDDGQDVSEIVSRVDGNYLDNFGRGRYQGITRDHWVELELPADAPNENLRLIAQGWLHPTDASINVAISQGSVAHPESLSIEVPDGRGGWKKARSNLGFPAGKIKTIVIELDDVMCQIPAGAPRRLRLRTNMEIYWDALAWATEVSSDKLKIERSAPTFAEIRFRGFSEMTQVNRSSPEIPNYAKVVNTTQKWRDLIGYYTRYGDIRELLEKQDDRYVIVNAGDEMRFRFAAHLAPPDDYKRDFVMIGDGWIKDGDFNSVFSQTVLPLPRHGQSEYRTLPARLEDDPVYQLHKQDWERFHTRYVTPERFEKALRAIATTQN